MARVAVELTNFTGGELSPRLDGRTDLTKYTSGCSTLENLIVYPHGSAARRPGSTFLAEVANSANKTRLIPFEFSTTQTYMLEFSNLKMRVYKDSGAVLEGDKTISAITKANPAVVTSTSHGYENGNEVQLETAKGMSTAYVVELNKVKVGDIELYNILGVVSDDMPGITLLGMSFLGKLDMKRKGNTMVLEK